MRSLHTQATRPIIPGLTLELAFRSKTSDTPSNITKSRSTRRTQHYPSKRAKRKRPLLEQDSAIHETPPTKRIHTEPNQSNRKLQHDDNTSQHDHDEDESILWSHFDDWDWDAILPHIP
jgi:hypothetical protein